jgi:hypothetical protein
VESHLLGPKMCLTLFIIGKVLAFIGWSWIAILAWQRGIVWGVGCILLPVVELFYVGLHWKEAKRPFFFLLAGFGAIVLATLVGH